MDLKTRYRQTFAHMKAPPQLETEVLNLTEQKRGPKRFVVRRLLVAGIAAGMLGALAVGANAATGGELFDNIVISLAGEGFQEVESQDGTHIYRGELNGEDIYVTFEEPEGNPGSDPENFQDDGSQQEVQKKAQSVE